MFGRSTPDSCWCSGMIEVLLATYNGERWLPELLESLRHQSEQRFRILARDDGSSDGTLAILKDFQRSNPDKLHLIEDTDGNLGVKGNYNRLLEASTEPYVMFCDQDDVWMPDKIRMTWDAMLSLEEEHGSDTSILVHTDLEVVDVSLNTIDPSFWHYQNLDPSVGDQLNRVLVQNVVTGCASMANRALVDLASPIPDEAVMHDWWMVLAAAAFGIIEAVPKTTVLYRQHGVNILGAQAWNLVYFFRMTFQTLDAGQLRRRINLKIIQAQTFLRRYSPRLSPPDHEIIHAWANIMDSGWLGRRRLIWVHGFFMVGTMRNIGLLLVL